MLKKNLTPLYVSKKFYHQIEVWEKSFLHKPNHPYTAPLPPPPPRTSNGPAPIKYRLSNIIQSKKSFQFIQSPSPLSLTSPSTVAVINTRHPPHPPRVDWNVQLPGETPFKLKVFRNVTQSVGCLFVAECKEKPSQTLTSPFPLKV